MRIRSFFLVAASTAALASCGGNRLLVGQQPDGGGPPAGSAGTGGAAGAVGMGGVGGAAGAVGTGGVGGWSGQFGVGGAVGQAGAYTPPVDPPLPISGVEAVTRIATLLWSAAPDGKVLAQAQQGLITKKSDLSGPIYSMLTDARAASGVGRFYRWWLDLDSISTRVKDPQVFPTFTPTLQAAIAAETETFAVDVTLGPDGGGDFPALLTSPRTFANGPVAELYGVTVFDSPSGDLVPIALDPTQRASLLTQPALQVLTSFSNRTSPPARGVYIMERFFCQEIPLSPPTIPGELPVPAPNMTMRQALAADEAAYGASCAACHVLIDGPGLAFETFDAIGRWRTADNGLPIDVSNLALYSGGSGSSPVKFNGPIELAKAIAASPQAQECFARQWLAFATGAKFPLGPQTTTVDDASVAPVFAAFSSGNLRIQALITAVLSSDLFLAPH
jgi:hypothetical protein